MNNAQLTGLRNLATTAYPLTITFTRAFNEGPLSGTTHEDTLGFCSELDAEEWVAEVNRANRLGKLNYRIVKWSVRATGDR